jgi:phosphocarrier protein
VKTFQYQITDAVGIHARPAGLLVQEAKKYGSKIMLQVNGKSAEAAKLMALMSLGVKQGQTVTVSVEGADEDEACRGMKDFFRKNL